MKMIKKMSGKSPVKTRTHYSNVFKLDVIFRAQVYTNADSARYFGIDRRLVSKWRLKHDRFAKFLFPCYEPDFTRWNFITNMAFTIKRLEDRIYALTH